MNFAQSERAGICAAMLEVGPDAPTLCEGWTTYDLAAHLWLRETDPLGAPGIAMKPFAAFTERRMNELKSKFSFEQLVTKLRSGPVPYSLFAFPGVDDAANSIEFFVHHEDVRRAKTPPADPRDLGSDVEAFLWRRLRLLGRALFRRAQVGVMLERTGVPESPVRAMPGSRTVTVIGEPSELTLYAYGRRSAAHVELVGEPDALADLAQSDLGI